MHTGLLEATLQTHHAIGCDGTEGSLAGRKDSELVARQVQSGNLLRGENAVFARGVNVFAFPSLLGVGEQHTRALHGIDLGNIGEAEAVRGDMHQLGRMTGHLLELLLRRTHGGEHVRGTNLLGDGLHLVERTRQVLDSTTLVLGVIVDTSVEHRLTQTGFLELEGIGIAEAELAGR